MSQTDKLVSRLVDREQYKNLTFEELRRLLKRCGFQERIGGADLYFHPPQFASNRDVTETAWRRNPREIPIHSTGSRGVARCGMYKF